MMHLSNQTWALMPLVRVSWLFLHASCDSPCNHTGQAPEPSASLDPHQNHDSLELRAGSGSEALEATPHQADNPISHDEVEAEPEPAHEQELEASQAIPTPEETEADPATGVAAEPALEHTLSEPKEAATSQGAGADSDANQPQETKAAIRDVDSQHEGEPADG